MKAIFICFLLCGACAATDVYDDARMTKEDREFRDRFDANLAKSPPCKTSEEEEQQPTKQQPTNPGLLPPIVGLLTLLVIALFKRPTPGGLLDTPSPSNDDLLPTVAVSPPSSSEESVRSTTVTVELASACEGKVAEQETVDSRIQLASEESLSDESETLLNNNSKCMDDNITTTTAQQEKDSSSGTTLGLIGFCRHTLKIALIIANNSNKQMEGRRRHNKNIGTEAPRKNRTEQVVSIRKEKRDDIMSKRRNIPVFSQCVAFGVLLMRWLASLFNHFIVFFKSIPVGGMFGSAFFLLLPYAFGSAGWVSHLFAAFTFIVGINMFLLDKLLHGTGKRWLIFIGEVLHNFLDGFIVGAESTQSLSQTISVCVVVLCEEVPRGFGDVAKKGKMMLQNALYNKLFIAIPSFAGFCITFYFAHVTEVVPEYTQVFAAAIFLCYATSLLLTVVEDVQSAVLGLQAALGVCFGLACVFVMVRPTTSAIDVTPAPFLAPLPSPCLVGELLRDNGGNAVKCRPNVDNTAIGGCPGHTHFCHIGHYYNQSGCCPRTTTSADPCFLPINRGIGTVAHIRWHFNDGTERCEAFDYAGEKGNENNFVTKWHCEERCQEQPQKKRSRRSGKRSCDLPLEYGTGEQKLDRWYFDGNSLTCRPFLYTGVKGNANNFVSRDHCQRACPADNELVNYGTDNDQQQRNLPFGQLQQLVPSSPSPNPTTSAVDGTPPPFLAPLPNPCLVGELLRDNGG